MQRLYTAVLIPELASTAADDIFTESTAFHSLLVLALHSSLKGRFITFSVLSASVTAA